VLSNGSITIFVFKCKNIGGELNAQNIFATSPFSNKVFSTVAP
jgi:hypothetical protein